MNLLHEYIRDILSEINLGTGKGIEYTAFVLDDDVSRQLLQYAPSGWTPTSHHMTIISPTNQKQRLPSHWLDFYDNKGQMKVVKIAQNDKIITGLVDLGGLPIPIKGPAFPHVTIAVNPRGGGAEMSNNFKPEDFIAINKPIPLKGRVEEILR